MRTDVFLSSRCTYWGFLLFVKIKVERLYGCNYPGCTKAYGTLNHLNAHITMQKHGLKRMPQGLSPFPFGLFHPHLLSFLEWLTCFDLLNIFLQHTPIPFFLSIEFKEIRKEWRARKKAEAEARTANLKHYAGGAGGGPPHLGAMPSKTTIPTTTTTTPTSSTISQALHPSSNHHLLMNSYRDHHHDPWKLAAWSSYLLLSFLIILLRLHSLFFFYFCFSSLVCWCVLFSSWAFISLSLSSLYRFMLWLWFLY